MPICSPFIIGSGEEYVARQNGGRDEGRGRPEGRERGRQMQGDFINRDIDIEHEDGRWEIGIRDSNFL
jgi:hypothetical protein